MRVAAIAVVLVAGVGACGVPQPVNEEVPPPAWSDLASEVAVYEWADRMGQYGITDLEPPEIRWFAGSHLEYRGEHYSCPLGGFSQNLWHVEIHILRDEIPFEALAHELLHWALSESRGDHDAHHASPEWGQVPEVAEMARIATQDVIQ